MALNFENGASGMEEDAFGSLRFLRKVDKLQRKGLKGNLREASNYSWKRETDEYSTKRPSSIRLSDQEISD